MADESPHAAAAPALSARDLEILVHAFRNPKGGGEFEVDYDKLAVCLGSKTIASARSSWSAVKKKLSTNAPLASTAEGGPVVKAKTPRKKKEAAPKLTPKSDAKEDTDVSPKTKKSKSDDTAAENADTAKTNHDATTADTSPKEPTSAEADGKDKAHNNETVAAGDDTASKDTAPITPAASPVTSQPLGSGDEAEKPVDGGPTTAIASDKDDTTTPAKTPIKKKAAAKKATPKGAATTNGDTKEGDKKVTSISKKRGRPTNAERAAALVANGETVEGKAGANDSEVEKPATKKRKTAAKKKPVDTSNVTEAEAEAEIGDGFITVGTPENKSTAKSPTPAAAPEKKKATPKPRTPKPAREPSKAAKAKQAKLDAATKEDEEEAQRATKEANAKSVLADKKATEAKAASDANDVLLGKKIVATEVKEDHINGDGDGREDDEANHAEVHARLNDAIASTALDMEAAEPSKGLSKDEGTCNTTKSGFTAVNTLGDGEDDDADTIVVNASKMDA